mgnify:CR=1 FL=1
MASTTTERILDHNWGCASDCKDSHKMTLKYIGTSNLYLLTNDEGEVYFDMDEWKALLEMIAEIGDAGTPLKLTQ